MTNPNLVKEVLKIEADVQNLARTMLLPFTLATKKDYWIGNHHKLIAGKLTAVLNGTCKRLMIFLPPRHGKTEIASIRFPAFSFGINPNLRFLGCSYGSELADKNNRLIQRIIESPEYKAIFPDTKLSDGSAAQRSFVRNSTTFDIVNAVGGYRSAGVGGAITGTGADILLIDDPIKNKKEAESLVYRDAIWDWYTSTAYTRLEKNGAIILIQTRWHEDDLAGRLLKKMKEGGEYSDQWDVLSLEAICEQPTKDDWRIPGEPLWPWKYDLDALYGIKTTVGTRDWTALYQQKPTPLTGSLFKTKWWNYYREIPIGPGEIVQFWDSAQKAGLSNDYTVCATWKRMAHGFYLLDLWRDKVEAPELEKMSVALYHKWMPNRVVIEDKSSGSSLIQHLQRKTTIPVLPVNPTLDKVLRAINATPMVEAGNCYLPQNAPWLADFILEHEHFPNTAHDDQVDTTSMAIDYFKRFSSNKPRVRSL